MEDELAAVECPVVGRGGLSMVLRARASPARTCSQTSVLISTLALGVTTGAAVPDVVPVDALELPRATAGGEESC